MADDKRPQLINWLLHRLHFAVFKQGPLRGKAQLVLQYELDLDNQNEAAAKLQGLQRMFNARSRCRQVTMVSYEKRYNREAGRYYYVFVPKNEDKYRADAFWQWVKPRALEYRGLSFDCADPPDEWREMKTAESPPVTYYMNGGTGQESYMNPEMAANKIQVGCRNYLNREIGSVTTKAMIKALRIQQEAEEKYAAFPDRLSSIVNWAMVLHVMHHDIDEARKLYKQAMEISPENPVLLRAYALFSLMIVETPRSLTWSRAMENLRAARVRDPNRDKFKVAEESLFHWAVICNPKSPRCLLNYALLMQGVVEDFDLAEKFYRRAIAADPDDRFVVRNYQDFETERLPGGLYAGGGPPLSVLKTSVVKEEKFEWGEWKLMTNERATDERFVEYWANELGGRTSWEVPNWEEIWEVRVKRSQLTQDLGKWRELWDPKLKIKFFQNTEAKPHEFRDTNPFTQAAA